MKTLEDAWKWYSVAKSNLDRMKRLGTTHWSNPSLAEASIWTDERFKQLKAANIVSETTMALEPLDDLGVLLLFSVFEATVREYLEGLIAPLLSQLGHPILRQAGEDALEGVRQGSLANNVLSPLQKQKSIPPALAAGVKEVRDYRNWVAHGKRDPRPGNVVNLTPLQAFERLKKFMEVLGLAVESESGDSEVPNAKDTDPTMEE